MSQIWLHSDWHWRHENIYKFVTREGGPRIRERFQSMADGDAYIEQRIRDLVRQGDHLWMLGDLCMFRENHQHDEFVKFFRSLPVYGLLLGNHDHLKMRHYMDAGFKKIKAIHRIADVLLTHIPVHPTSIGPKNVGNAHGHIHAQASPAGPYFNCSVEAINYEPVPFEVVQDRLRELKQQHRQTDVSGNLMTGD